MELGLPCDVMDRDKNLLSEEVVQGVHQITRKCPIICMYYVLKPVIRFSITDYKRVLDRFRFSVKFTLFDIYGTLLIGKLFVQ